MKISYLYKISIALLVASAISCGGSSNDATGNGDDGTTYSVTVTDPVNQQQRTSHSLSADNFEVAIVDESGNVIEVVTITSDNITEFPNGSYGIYVPGNPRLDCVIVVDISGPITVTVGNPLPPQALYAPTTAIDVDIDVQSTVAYQSFIESVETVFSDYTIEEVEELVNEVQLAEITALTNGQTLEDYLLEVEIQVGAIIDAAIQILGDSTPSDVNALLESSGGAYDVYSDYGFGSGSLYFENFFVDSETGVFDIQGYYYTGSELVAEPFYDCTINNDCEYLLTANGWVQETNENLARTTNSDGSITLANSVESYTLSNAVMVDLSGLNMVAHFSGVSNNVALGIPLSAVFSAGAEWHNLDVNINSGSYYIYPEDQPYIISGDGNAANDGAGITITTASDIVVNSASTIVNPLNITGIRTYDFYVTGSSNAILEFVSGGVLNFYDDQGQLAGAGTWELRTLNGEEILVVLTIPANITSYAYSITDEEIIYSVLNNQLISGYHTVDDTINLDWYNEIVINDLVSVYVSPNSILAASSTRNGSRDIRRSKKLFKALRD